MDGCSAGPTICASGSATRRGQTGLADELGACVLHNNGYLLQPATVYLNGARVCACVCVQMGL